MKIGERPYIRGFSSQAHSGLIHVQDVAGAQFREQLFLGRGVFSSKPMLNRIQSATLNSICQVRPTHARDARGRLVGGLGLVLQSAQFVRLTSCCGLTDRQSQAGRLGWTISIYRERPTPDRF